MELHQPGLLQAEDHCWRSGLLYHASQGDCHALLPFSTLYDCHALLNVSTQGDWHALLLFSRQVNCHALLQFSTKGDWHALLPFSTQGNWHALSFFSMQGDWHHKVTGMPCCLARFERSNNVMESTHSGNHCSSTLRHLTFKQYWLTRADSVSIK